MKDFKIIFFLNKGIWEMVDGLKYCFGISCLSLPILPSMKVIVVTVINNFGIWPFDVCVLDLTPIQGFLFKVTNNHDFNGSHFINNFEICPFDLHHLDL